MKCLVVDHSATMRRVLGNALRGLGCDVVEAADGKIALDRCDRDTAAVLTAWNMPGMTGIELVERVRACDAELPVIMLTASSADLDLACRRLCITLLRKPLEIARLKSALPRTQDLPTVRSPVGAALPAGFDAR